MGTEIQRREHCKDVPVLLNEMSSNKLGRNFETSLLFTSNFQVLGIFFSIEEYVQKNQYKTDDADRSQAPVLTGKLINWSFSSGVG